MPTDSDLFGLKGKDLQSYGFARVRDIAFDAVRDLWDRRKSEGWQQIDLVKNLDCDPGWVSRNLRGPGNWTFQTFGSFIAGLNGEVDIKVRALEDPLPVSSNFHVYAGYDLDVVGTTSTAKITITRGRPVNQGLAPNTPGWMNYVGPAGPTYLSETLDHGLHLGPTGPTGSQSSATVKDRQST